MFFGAFALVIFGRLVQLQIIEHPRYAKAAQNELAGDDTIYAHRGSILDRNGNVLAASVDTWDIHVSTPSWKDPAVATLSSTRLAQSLNLDAAQLRETVAQTKAVDIVVKRDVDYDTGRDLMKDGVAGVWAEAKSKRVNPEGDTAASILGLTGTDRTGLSGLESSYNDALTGTPGKVIYERDTTGEPIPIAPYVATEPQPGEDLVLTIDRYLQQMAEQRLDEAIQQHGASGGDIIIMDPSNGDILALATAPRLKYSTLDLNDPAQISLLSNTAVSNLYEPGSVMKIVTASAAIDQGVVTPETTYVDTGVAMVSGVPIRNFQNEVWGTQTMTQVLENSINTGAIFMVDKLGASSFQKYLDAFGFGKPSGIDFPGEASGIFRRPTDAGWSPVDLATQSFGQSINVTPIQMLNAVATAINGGTLIKPHLVKETVGPNGVPTEVKPEVIGRAISEQTSATIRGMLNKVVELDPPNESLRNPINYTAGGKSGTANVPVYGSYNDRQIASFVGFAPLDHPRILVLVKLDDNKDLMTGTMAGGPIFSKLADDVLAYLGVPPDKGPNKP
jgi:cell division protein FtsI/penicillin-binding protein 2